MACILELTELSEGYHVPEVEVCAGWVDTKFYPEFFAGFELFFEFFADDDVGDAFLKNGLNI